MKPKNVHGISLYASHGAFPLIFIIFVLLYAGIIWKPRIYPFTDVPNHLGIATIYRHYGEEDNHFKQFYTINPAFKPNTFHIFFCSMEIFPSVEYGNKVFFCLYAVLLPFSVLGVIKKYGGNPWFSLLSFLFLFNYNVSYGFVGYTIAIPFLLVLVSLVPGYLKCRSPYAAFAIAALLLLLFFMHTLMALFALFFFMSCTTYCSRNSLKHILLNTAVALPAAIFILAWWRIDTAEFGDRTIAQALLDYYLHDYRNSLRLRGGLFILDNYALFEGLRGQLTAAGFSLFTILAILTAKLSNKTRTDQKAYDTAMVAAIIFLSCALACFFFIPLSLPGYGFLVQRFSVLFFLACIILGSMLAATHIHGMLKVCICFTVLIHALCWQDYMQDFNTLNRSFSKKLFETCDSSKVLTGLVFDNHFRGRPIYKQCADYYIVWQKGIAATRLIDERSFCLRRRNEWEGISPYIDHGDYKDIDRLDGISYILVRGEIPESSKKIFGRYFLKKPSGMWALFQEVNSAM